MPILKIIKKVLEIPFIFNLFEKIMGAKTPREKFIKNFVKPEIGEKILDMGCGTGELIDFFPNEIDYLGIDNNSDYINFAKKKYGDRGNFICTSVGNEIETIKDDHFDIVMSAGVLHHLNDEDSINLLKKSIKALKVGGRFISFDPVFVHNQKFISNFLIKNDRGNFVRNINGYEYLLKKVFQNVEIIHKNDLHHYPYDILIMKAFK